jgi:hypothetical protein
MTVQTFFGCLLYWAMEQGEENLADQMKLTMDLFFEGITC